jgi:hypothetical protein
MRSRYTDMQSNHLKTPGLTLFSYLSNSFAIGSDKNLYSDLDT